MNNQQSSIETTEKISTLLLCNPHFLSNFNEQYVKGLSLVQWLPEMGMRHQLNAVSAESYDILMVDESCPINYSSFICWLRVLKINGALVLPKSAQANIDAFFEVTVMFAPKALSCLLTLSPTSNITLSIAAANDIPSATTSATKRS